MKKSLGIFLAAFLISCGAAWAQDQATMKPPKVLIIGREFLKPGKAGTPHEKTEAAYVQAFTRAKWPHHYLAAQAMTGRSRALFLSGYDSLEAAEKDQREQQKNTALSAAIDRADIADGELMTDDSDSAFFAYREDLSYNAGLPVTEFAHMRYFEIRLTHVKPGHTTEYLELLKTVNEVRRKANLADHYASYQLLYGGPTGEFIYLHPIKSLAELDQAHESQAFSRAAGEEGLKKIEELAGKAVESTYLQLFHFAPRMSYVGEDLIQADPEFWKPKPRATTAAAAGEKKEKPKATGE